MYLVWFAKVFTCNQLFWIKVCCCSILHQFPNLRNFLTENLSSPEGSHKKNINFPEERRRKTVWSLVFESNIKLSLKIKKPTKKGPTWGRAGESYWVGRNWCNSIIWPLFKACSNPIYSLSIFLLLLESWKYPSFLHLMFIHSSFS